MTFIPAANVAKAVVLYHHGTDEWTNTYWFYKLLHDTDDLTALAGIVDTAVSGALLPGLSTVVYYDRTTVYGMNTSTDPIVVDSTGAGHGNESGEPIPVSSPLVCTLRTTSRGRSGRGRTYISGFGEDHWNGTVYDSQATEAVLSLISALRSLGSAISWTFGICSFQEDGVVRSSGLFRPVTSYEIRNAIPAKQKRRAHRP